MTARASDRARSSHGPRIRCALLTAFAHEWISPLALSCDEIDWLTLHPSALGLPASPNLFRLPVDDHADLVLLERTWYDWLQSHYPDRAEAVLARLERLGLAALDGGDDFALGFPPAILTRVRLLIKPQGLYRDRALYNYTVGAWHPGALWTEKVRPRTERYGDADLDKLRLSVPCFLMDVPALKRRARRREQGEARTVHRSMSRPERFARDRSERLAWRLLAHAPIRHRPFDVHCLVALTHAQRLDALRKLRGLRGTQGIAALPEHVAGVEGHRSLPDEAAIFGHPRLGRFRFIVDVLRHRVVVAPTGYGELGQRHGLALFAGAALVCQDLSHVDLMFPLLDGRNVAYCRPDLTDLRQVVEDLLNDEPRRTRIAQQGRRDYRTWAARWREHLRGGIEAHVREAVSPR
jgi:hypothetical protein